MKSRRSLEFGWLTLLGIPGNVWCGMSHICVDGHLYRKEMPQWWIACDLVWAAAFVGAAIAVARSDVRARFIPFSFLLLLVLSRLLVASGGGSFYIFELPMLLYVGVNSVWTIVHRERKLEALGALSTSTV